MKCVSGFVAVILMSGTFAFFLMYAIEDYQTETLADEFGVPIAAGPVRNVTVNLLGAGLPINFPWTKSPLVFDLGAYSRTYLTSMRYHFLSATKAR